MVSLTNKVKGHHGNQQFNYQNSWLLSTSMSSTNSQTSPPVPSSILKKSRFGPRLNSTEPENWWSTTFTRAKQQNHTETRNGKKIFNFINCHHWICFQRLRQAKRDWFAATRSKTIQFQAFFTLQTDCNFKKPAFSLPRVQPQKYCKLSLVTV